MATPNYLSLSSSSQQATTPSSQASLPKISYIQMNIMKSLFLIFCLLYILPTVLSHSHLPHISSREAAVYIQPNPPNTTSLLSTFPKAAFALPSYQVGFGRIVKGGVLVQLGTEASTSFHIHAKAVDSHTLAEADQDVKAVLNVKRAFKVKKQLKKLKNNYDGGLSIPFLNLLGFDLDKELNLTRVELRSKNLINTLGLQTFNKLNKVANETVRKFANTEVVMKGNVDFVGESFSPEVLMAYIKLAKINYLDGTTVTVLGAAKNDVVERSDRGVFSTVAGSEIVVENVKIKKSK